MQVSVSMVSLALSQSRKTSSLSLWYVLGADHTVDLTIEPDHFAEVRWWNIDDVLATPIDRFDPGMHRFIRKLQQSGLI